MSKLSYSSRNHAHIVLLGAGQIGSRHLQGLSTLKLDTDISVVDTDANALTMAKKRFEEMPENPLIHSVHYFQSIDCLDNEVDLLIVATSANKRRQLVDLLLDKLSIRYLLLEKITFQQVEDFNHIISRIQSKKIKAWVNCPRRVYPCYQNLKEIFGTDAPISMRASGGDWGLCSNSVHLIDLFNYFNNDLIISAVYADFDQPIRRAKRVGYVELTGEYVLQASNGAKLLLRSDHQSTRPVLMHFETKSQRVLVNEAAGKMYISNEKSGWKEVEENFNMLFQSQITGNIANDILLKSVSQLPTLSESFLAHKPMLTLFEAHFSRFKKNHDEVICIT